MTPGGGDLQGPAGLGLPDHLRQVRYGRRRHRGRLRLSYHSRYEPLVQRRIAADELVEVRDRVDADAGDQPGLVLPDDLGEVR